MESIGIALTSCWRKIRAILGGALRLTPALPVLMRPSISLNLRLSSSRLDPRMITRVRFQTA